MLEGEIPEPREASKEINDLLEEIQSIDESFNFHLKEIHIIKDKFSRNQAKLLRLLNDRSPINSENRTQEQESAPSDIKIESSKFFEIIQAGIHPQELSKKNHKRFLRNLELAFLHARLDEKSITSPISNISDFTLRTNAITIKHIIMQNISEDLVNVLLSTESLADIVKEINDRYGFGPSDESRLLRKLYKMRLNTSMNDEGLINFFNKADGNFEILEQVSHISESEKLRWLTLWVDDSPELSNQCTSYISECRRVKGHESYGRLKEILATYIAQYRMEIPMVHRLNSQKNKEWKEDRNVKWAKDINEGDISVVSSAGCSDILSVLNSEKMQEKIKEKMTSIATVEMKNINYTMNSLIQEMKLSRTKYEQHQEKIWYQLRMLNEYYPLKT